MNASEIRQTFFDFFESKGHKIVASAPIVVKDDPTLMFTNAGMNQFKDLFLGNKTPEVRRIANSQKCLRVSGKHNDLEEVGRDSYHHTMFEMLGNWSIGDYFKEDAIAWAWELLTERYGLPKDRIYASVFMGDEAEGLEPDDEAAEIWKKYLPEDRILYSSKKDNFWEMGDTGPCGPCSELHFDLRPENERALIPGRDLVNRDNPLVVEIWNLVFIQYNRKADGSLESLPDKHVDTGMGFERLCMCMQAKTSNYDTDVFSPFIEYISKESGVAYTGLYQDQSRSDIAMRVLADHVRAVSFAIADGEMPSNSGAGYVIRRILRRSIRYNFSYLGQKEPFVYKVVPMLAAKFKNVFPELEAQVDFVKKVILEEEKSFLRTLEAGLKRLETIHITDGVLDGKVAFELYDTYGFPIDLTKLIGEEKGWSVDQKAFEEALLEQKTRSRADAKRETGDWIILRDDQSVQFVGYDQFEIEDAEVIKYRSITQKDQTSFQIVLSRTPFYPEGGGQVGDTGYLMIQGDIIRVTDTKKENDLIIHFVDALPEKLHGAVKAWIDGEKRYETQANHTATHLLHAALRRVLGTHVQQKGSLVKDESLRFDFSHIAKMTDQEIKTVEKIVNEKIRQNISLIEDRQIPIDEAREKGAMMLFGEKYGDQVRMITFDPSYSRELCGGCHVKSTGEIGFFKLVAEGAIAAGVRRVEALTGARALAYVDEQIAELQEIKSLFKSPLHTSKLVEQALEENKNLKKEVEKLLSEQLFARKDQMLSAAYSSNGVSYIKENLGNVDGKSAKNLAYSLLQSLGTGAVFLAFVDEGKPQVMLAVSEDLTKEKGLHAGKTIKTLAALINGGGGGQAHFATAGGKDQSGLDQAMNQFEAAFFLA